MDRLSSCYFCGDALDASLDEYPVVPRALDPPDDVQQTVVLCRSCGRKLDSLLGTVVEAVEDGTDGTDGTDGDDRGHSPEPALDDGADALRSVNDRETTGGGVASDPEPAPDAESDPEANPDPDPGTDSAPIPDSGDGSDGADGRNGSDGTDDGDGPDGGDGSGTTLTRLEYNRVMRLLQNREFPVERAGFVTVAANAYELSPDDCERVLDAAIDHGIIEERNGQLIKPEGEGESEEGG